MTSFGFMIYAIGPAYSNYEKIEIKKSAIANNQKLIQVPLNSDGSINVKLSEEQLEKLISKPTDVIGNRYVVGCGDGIYFTDGTNFHLKTGWTKVK
jgi:hypothetical protein